MNSLERKIRASQWSLDEKRRNVTELEILAADFRTKIEQLDRDLEATRDTTAADPVPPLRSREQVSQAASRRNNLQQSLKMLESVMARALEEVDATHGEFKRFDLIKSRNQKKVGLK